MKKAGGGGASSSAAAKKAALRQMMKAEQQRQATAHHRQTTQSGEQAAHHNAHHPAQAPPASAAVQPPRQPSRGVLRKSKYSAAPAPAAAKHGKNDDRGNDGGGGLANLLGGYDSSSSSGEEGANCSSMPNGRGPTAARSASADDRPEAAIRSAAASSDMVSAAASVALETAEEEVGEPQTEPGQSDQPSDGDTMGRRADTAGKDTMDDDTWKEFEDLVGEDDADEEAVPKPSAKPASAGDGIQEEQASAVPTTEPVDTDAAQSAASASASASAAPAVDSSEVEQAAYEARLGRLMMLRAVKARPGAGTDDDPGRMEALRDVEYASAGLGFGEEEEEIGGSADKEATVARGQDNATAHLGSASSVPTPSAVTKASKKRSMMGLSSGSALAIMKRKKAKVKQIATEADMLAEYGEDDQGGFA